ncbi:MAG: LacI family DNA-binding transcriptional regulator [Bacteroidales bacterium]|nr:LacI family DNA-binding transcriptional regulator [Bacteroidales bacterium]
MKRITIKDIARDLKIHHSTVSRALRGSSTVSFDTRKKVNEYAREIGYQVNMNALQLRGSLKNMIAIVVPNIYHNFFSNVVSLVADLAFRKGFVVSIFQSNESYLQEKEIVQMLIRNNVAGVVASVSMETQDSGHLRALSKYRIPLVLFDRVCPDLEVTKVMVNNQEVVASATEILIERGYRHIAHISGPSHINVFGDRQAGYLSALKKHGLDYQRIVRIESGFTIDQGKETAASLFMEKTRPDALLCDSHLLSLGAIFKIRELQLKIPEDVGIVGFGDNPYIDSFNPGMISIVQPDALIASTVFELIFKRIENFDAAISETKMLPASIIEK